MPLQDKNTFWEGAFPLRCRFSRPLSHCTRFRRLSKVEIVLLVESWRELKRVETKRGEVTRRGGHLCRVADNTVWSHWQVASRSSEVNFTKNYTLLFVMLICRLPVFNDALVPLPLIDMKMFSQTEIGRQRSFKVTQTRFLDSKLYSWPLYGFWLKSQKVSSDSLTISVVTARTILSSTRT